MPPGLATTCAGNATWMCLSGGFRGILDHACWGGYKDLRLSGGFRKDLRPFALGRAKVLGSVSSRVTLMGRSLPACDYGYHLGHSARLASTFATRRQSDTLRSSHRKPALLPTCKGSRGGQASEVAPSQAQGGGRGITRMAEHRGRNRRRHFRLLEACCACCSRWRQ